MSERYNLPAATAGLINDHITRCKNLALILDKYPTKAAVEDTKFKGSWLQGLIKENHIDIALTQSAYNRWHIIMLAMGAILFNASLDWRMVIGLGGKTVLETDITLHHLYGIPIIPGSALKGLTRSYVTTEYKQYYIPENQPEEQRKPSKKTDEDHLEIKRIFGSQEQVGTVTFFDAMPLPGTANFVLDIMNPHYPDYYSGSKAPTNDQDPRPITFLAVQNATFTFALALRNPHDLEHKDDLDKAKGWLQEALQKYGVGGKTSAGYGYFKKEMPSIESPQLEKTQEPIVQAPSGPVERIRPALPQFRAGQEITGAVVAPTDDLRRKAPTDAKAFLRYQSFATTDVLIAVSSEEAQNWKPGETRICVFVREEERNGCTVLVCQSRVKKDKKK
jgi:CRISPR type III-B/RAMP module RAMP protein Cmr6